MLSFDAGLTNALKNSNSTAFWVLKLYYNDESDFIGVSDRHRQDGTDIYYGLVASWGSYRQSLDFFNFTTSIGNMSLTLINADKSIQGKRFSDLLATNNFGNRKWELFLNTNETATLDTAARMIASGIISGDIKFDTNNVTFSLLDSSEKKHKQLPRTVIDATTYPNAPEKNINKPIPIAYGDFADQPAAQIGTIPTTPKFDYFFTLGKFPALITNTFDQDDGYIHAQGDSLSMNTLDSDNIYIYNSGYYSACSTSNTTIVNPTLKFKGTTWYLYVPINSSQANVSDGKFNTLYDIVANDELVSFKISIPELPNLGIVSRADIIANYGDYTMTDSSQAEFLDVNIQVDGIGGDTLKTTVPIQSGDGWDISENELVVLLDNGDVSHIEIKQLALQVTYAPTKTFTKTITRFNESSPSQQFGYGDNVYDTAVYQTGVQVTSPADLDVVYFSGKGRQHGAYIDADSRDQGYNKNTVIINPIFMIENILRSELGVIYKGAATSTTSNKLVDTNAAFATSVIGQTVYNITDKTSAMVTARDSGTILTLDTNIMASGEVYTIGGLTSSEIDHASFDVSGNTSSGFIGDAFDYSTQNVSFAFSQYKFINSRDLIQKIGRQCFSWVFLSGDGRFKIKTLRRTDDYSSSDQTIDFGDIDLKGVSKTSLNSVRNDISVNYNYDYGQNQNLSEIKDSDATSQGTAANGYGQILKFKVNADFVLDTGTATQMADAYKVFFKDRKDVVEFGCVRPKYNHLEIGDIIDFSDWPATLRLYGQTLGGSWDSTTETFSSVSTTWANMAGGYFIVSDITKTVTGCSIKAIKVS